MPAKNNGPIFMPTKKTSNATASTLENGTEPQKENAFPLNRKGLRAAIKNGLRKPRKKQKHATKEIIRVMLRDKYAHSQTKKGS